MEHGGNTGRWPVMSKALDQVKGLIAHGRTIQDMIEIARDVAKNLMEAQTNITCLSSWRPGRLPS